MGGRDQESRWEGRYTAITPVTPQYYDFLYALSTDEATGFRWRYRATTPSPEEFVSGLWQNVACQFVAVNCSTREPFGHLAAHDPDVANGVVFVSMCFAPEVWGQGWPLEAAAVFADHLFRSFDLRKIYAEAPEYNTQPFSSAIGTLLDLEGRYRERYFHDGRYWDLLILALPRERWVEWRPRLLPRSEEESGEQPERVVRRLGERSDAVA